MLFYLYLIFSNISKFNLATLKILLKVNYSIYWCWFFSIPYFKRPRIKKTHSNIRNCDRLCNLLSVLVSNSVTSFHSKSLSLLAIELPNLINTSFSRFLLYLLVVSKLIRICFYFNRKIQFYRLDWSVHILLILFLETINKNII